MARCAESVSRALLGLAHSGLLADEGRYKRLSLLQVQPEDLIIAVYSQRNISWREVLANLRGGNHTCLVAVLDFEGVVGGGWCFCDVGVCLPSVARTRPA